MNRRFDALMEELNRSMIEMAALAENAIARAARALEERDAAEARSVIESDEIMDDKEREIESRCLKLLLTQHPVARDLRQISTALKMVTDLERIGDQAADISELCEYLSSGGYVKKLEHIPRMARETAAMVTDSIDAFVRRDADAAREVIARDDVVDGLFAAAKRDLIALVHEDADNGEGAFDLLQVAKYYERIGDHAVNIAEWVIFSITGVHKDRQVL